MFTAWFIIYLSSFISRWLGVRLELLGSVVVFAAAMFAVIGKNTLSGGLVGLSISYALQVGWCKIGNDLGHI